MKKLIAVICTLAILLSLVPLLPPRAAALDTENGAYQVGYARVDINPYVVEDDPTSGLMALPLAGLGDDWDRLSNDTLLDDNGDGIVDCNDGLKATCISITDANGGSVLMITADFLSAELSTKIRNAVLNRVNTAIADGELTGLQELTDDQIYYSTTHTHSSVSLYLYSVGTTGTNKSGADLSVVNDNLDIWIDRTMIDIADSAILALKDRASAELVKDQLSVQDATSPVLKNKILNSTRHYFTDIEGGETFVTGDNFSNVYKSSYTDRNDYRTAQGVDPKQLTQVDDNIYLLRFQFADENKLPVVLAQLARECIQDGLHETPVDHGTISTTRRILYIPHKTVGVAELAYKAALAHQETIKTTTIYTYPYKYTDPDTGETYLIASKHHAKALLQHWNPTTETPGTTPSKVILQAFTLGDDVAFVTMPGEAFDYYYQDITLTGDVRYAASNNLWNILTDDATFGKPFILGYCNGALGYLPNHDAYIYNQGSDRWAMGAYEAHKTKLEQGSGETIVRTYDVMLSDLLSGDGGIYTGPCAHCGEDQLWQPYPANGSLTSGHYYLYGDVWDDQVKIFGGQTVCLDLNGYTLKGNTRAIYTTDTTKDVLSIMDLSEAQTGGIYGCGAKAGAAVGLAGGTVYLAEGDTLNLYSGTIGAFKREDYYTSTGGVLYIRGTFNMYGGKVRGGTVSSFTGDYYSSGKIQSLNRTGNGGAISVLGTVNLYGGEITDGATQLVTGTVTNGTVNNFTAEVISASGHIYETVRVDATCTTDGSITKICKSCGDIQTETITAPGHRYEAVVTAPTCTEGGFTMYTCACGDSYTADEVAAWGHSYDVNVVAPDCVIPGTTYDADTGRYIAHAQGIHAKYLGDTVYLAVYAKLADGTYAYCASQSTKGGTIADLAMATAVYGYHAKQYFD